MNKLTFSTRIALVLLLLATCAPPSLADEIDSESLQNDNITLQLAANYGVVAVREAIAKCREGNYKEALPVLSKFAADRDVGATYVLAKLHLDGLGVEKSSDRAIELLQNNVEGGHAPSMVVLARLKQKESPAEALQLYKMASALDEVSAHVQLGSIMENGALGARANPQLAFKYYKKAMDAKNPIGIYHVARCYDAGVGVSPNAIESTRLYRQAAMSGIPAANTVMARRYFEGSGVEPDPVAAVGWLLRGSHAGATDAMVLLGQRYEAGDVIGKDLNRAGQLYSRAAKLNDPTGRFLLARMYSQGVGTKADPVRAYVLLEGAQDLPMAKAEFEKLAKQLTPEQLTLAQKKIAEAKARESKN